MVSKSICLFMIYSFLGWIYETIFCTCTKGRWSNRGFLYGPVCPIYGVGASIITIIIYIVNLNYIVLNPTQVFVISVIGSAILEYTVSYLLEKIFHAIWWSYENWPLNIKGRVSLFSSLGFGLGGLIIYYKIVPISTKLVNMVPSQALSIISYVLVFVFAVDTTLTISALHNFNLLVESAEKNFNKNMTEIVDDAKIYLKNHTYGLTGVIKSTVKRVRVFRGEKSQKEKFRNIILSVIKKKKNNYIDKIN